MRCVKNVVSAVEKLAVASPPAASLATLPVLSVSPAVENTFADVAQRNLQPRNILRPGAVHGVHGGPHQQVNARHRSRSPQVKRSHEGDDADEDGYRRQGRPRHLKRPAAAGASKVVVEDVGDLHPSLQYYIGNTPGKASGDVIKKVLERCAIPLLQGEEGPLVIESVEPRTRCWRIVVPYKFKDLMENSMLYPEGWRYREFVGIFKNPSVSAKKIRRNDNSIVDQVMGESEQEQSRDQKLQNLQKELQLLRQQGTTGQPVAGVQAGAGSGPPAQLA